MGYLDENEWILLNEIAYNISYIFTVEEMQDEILNRWLPILIPYDAAVLARLSRTADGGYVFTETYGYHLSPKMLDIWQEQTQKADAYRWLLYSNTSATFRESAFREEDKLKNTPIYESFYEPNGLCYSAGLCICFREEPVGFLRLYRRKEKGEFAERDLFALSQGAAGTAHRLCTDPWRAVRLPPPCAPHGGAGMRSRPPGGCVGRHRGFHQCGRYLPQRCRADFHQFRLGKYSVIEDYSCLNNAVGDIIIGDYCRIGLSNTVIGPIRIDNGVNISQNVVLIGLNHNYRDITKNIIEQGITTSPIHIGEHTIIGANVIVLPGVNIGKHCFIGAGCVVTKDIPDYCVTVGNPARIIKRFNPQTQMWEKVN